MTINELIEAFKKVSEQSNILITWAFSIIGASILAIVSTSYLKPTSFKIKLIYLLFLPGWAFLGISIYYGNLIARSLLAALFIKNTTILNMINQDINTSFLKQLNTFFYGLIFFGLWLIAYIIWWIFDKWSINNKN